MKRIAIFEVLSLVFIVSIGQVIASTFKKVEVVCPLCQTRFETTLQMSGSSFGQRLDLKPLGPITAPWPLPVCPKDDFVIFKDDFTDQEKKHLEKFVHSKEYKDLVEDNPSYFLLARIYESLNESEFKIAHTYLKASWEVEGKKPDQHERCLKASLDRFEKFLSHSERKGKEWETAELVSGEIERRLGRFDDARKRFQRLSRLPEFKSELFAGVIELQISLIENRDSDPHEIPKKK